MKRLDDQPSEHVHRHHSEGAARRCSNLRCAGKAKTFQATPEGQETLEDLLDGLLESAEAPTWAANCTRSHVGTKDANQAVQIDPSTDAADGLPEEYSLSNTFLCILLVPQFSLRSDADEKAEMVISALVATMRSFSVNDTRYEDDPVNSLVMHRSYGDLKGLQIFYPHSARDSSIASSTSSRFIPIEVLLDANLDPYHFDRITPATVAMLRYDKFNRLRIRSTADHSKIGSEHIRKGVDQASIAVGTVSVAANPEQFSAFFSIVTDLLLYSDTAQKGRSEKLEAALLLHDFSDLIQRAEVVQSYQQRIRDMSRILKAYNRDLGHMTSADRASYFRFQSDLLREEEELHLEVEAIRHSQQRGLSAASDAASGLALNATAHQLVWNMLSVENQHLVKLAVTGVNFDWLSKSDSTTSNSLVIKDLEALNTRPFMDKSSFDTIIAKYRGTYDHELAKRDLFLVAAWVVLPPVGGIPIVEKLEIHLHPIYLQLERRVGQEITDYIFSSSKLRRQKGQSSQADVRASEKSPTKRSQRSSLYPSSNRSIGTHSTESLISNSSDEVYKHSRHAHAWPSHSIRGETAHSTLSTLSFSRDLRKTQSVDNLSVDKSILSDSDRLDVDEMKARARANRTFVLANFSPTVICLSYKVRQPCLQNIIPLADIFATELGQKQPFQHIWARLQNPNFYLSQPDLVLLRPDASCKKGGHQFGFQTRW